MTKTAKHKRRKPRAKEEAPPADAEDEEVAVDEEWYKHLFQDANGEYSSWIAISSSILVGVSLILCWHHGDARGLLFLLPPLLLKLIM